MHDPMRLRVRRGEKLQGTSYSYLRDHYHGMLAHLRPWLETTYPLPKCGHLTQPILAEYAFFNLSSVVGLIFSPFYLL
jgi:hypothetical protein